MFCNVLSSVRTHMSVITRKGYILLTDVLYNDTTQHRIGILRSNLRYTKPFQCGCTTAPVPTPNKQTKT